MTNTKTTLADKRQIEEAINHVLAQKMYIPLSKEDFDITCPNPALAVNVVAAAQMKQSPCWKLNWLELVFGKYPASLSFSNAYL